MKSICCMKHCIFLNIVKKKYFSKNNPYYKLSKTNRCLKVYTKFYMNNVIMTSYHIITHYNNMLNIIFS